MEELKPNYYAIIPAEIRYSTELTPNAKLLYGEITALTNKEGYCWASNNYFAELYNTTPTSIINWLNQLEQKGFIEREIVYKDDTKQITDRYIKITNIPSKEILSRGSKEILTSPSKEILTQNNINMNNINYNNIYSEVVGYLNEKANTHYRADTNSTQRKIKARLNEKYTLDDFKAVIDKKVQEWKGTDFEQYLRPETLFGTKFESYLNAQVKENKGKKPPTRQYNKDELESLYTNLDEVVL